MSQNTIKQLATLTINAEVRKLEAIYGRSLTLEEIQQLYKALLEFYAEKEMVSNTAKV
jgi:hemolysin activation/secretion protein